MIHGALTKIFLPSLLAKLLEEVQVQKSIINQSDCVCPDLSLYDEETARKNSKLAIARGVSRINQDDRLTLFQTRQSCILCRKLVAKFYWKIYRVNGTGGTRVCIAEIR